MDSIWQLYANRLDHTARYEARKKRDQASYALRDPETGTFLGEVDAGFFETNYEPVKEIE